MGVETLDSRQEEKVFGIRDNSSWGYSKGFGVNMPSFDYKVVGILVIILLVEWYPEVAVAFYRAAVYCFREILTDLV